MNDKYLTGLYHRVQEARMMLLGNRSSFEQGSKEYDCISLAARDLASAASRLVHVANVQQQSASQYEIDFGDSNDGC